MSKINVGIIQFKAQEKKEQNIEKIITKIKALAPQKPDLIVLQELHNSLYFCQEENVDNFDLADEINDKSLKPFAKLATTINAVIVLSLFEKRHAGLYHNTAVVLEKDGKIAGIYRKMHIPDDPNFYEKFYFTPGDIGFKPINTSIGKLGVLICWDQWYPEAARLMALAGADILIYPTAIGWDINDCESERLRQQNSWQIIQQSHSVANLLPVVSVNRVGLESQKNTSGILFWGNSFVCAAGGQMLKVLSSTEEESAVVSVDLAQTESLRRIWPFFRDRRIDAYKKLTKRFLL